MATKKAATKKATKKPVKKAVAKKVVQTVSGKNNKQPVTAVKKTAVKKAAAPVANPLAPDLNLARRILAHDTIARSKLRVGDTIEILYHRSQPVHADWRSAQGCAMEFLGINDAGFAAVRYPQVPNPRIFLIPVEALDFNTVDTRGPSQDTTIKLNNSYSATVSRGSDEVRIGCQRIPVAKVREVAAALDKVNAPQPVRNRAATLGAGGQYAELVYTAK